MSSLREIVRLSLRERGDQRPIKWWEVVLFVAAFPLSIFSGFGCALAMFFEKSSKRQLEYLARKDNLTTENNKFRDLLRASNRYLTFEDVLERDPQHRGTLLKDPHQGLDWWTSDDLVSLAPEECRYSSVADRFSDEGVNEARHSYARQCYERYYGLENGAAFLLQSPRFNSANSKLLEDWPLDRVVYLSAVTHEDQIFHTLVTRVDFEVTQDLFASESGNAELDSSTTPMQNLSEIKQPIFGKWQLSGLLCFFAFIVAPSLLSFWSMPTSEWLLVPFLLIFLDLAFAFIRLVFFYKSVVPNEPSQHPRRYIGYAIGSLFALYVLALLIHLVTDFPWVWLSIAGNVVAIAAYHYLGYRPMASPYERDLEELPEMA